MCIARIRSGGVNSGEHSLGRKGGICAGESREALTFSMAPVRARHTRLDLGVIVAVAVVACARVAAATASHIDLSLLASSAGSAAKAPRIPCQWTVRF